MTAAAQKEQMEQVVVRFAGDSGDGVQVTGSQFGSVTAFAGNDLSTFPDFPAEIRAPAGTIPGVSGFQIQFGSKDVHTPGDRPDALVAFNPAALRVNGPVVKPNGIIIVNTDAFDERELRKAQYDGNPLEDGSLSAWQVHKVPITKLTFQALEELDLTHKEKERCKNFYALGLVYWLFSRPMEPTLKWFQQKFGKKPKYAEANTLALKAGYALGENSNMFRSQFEVRPAKYAPGTYRNISGNEAVALGIAAAGASAGVPVFYGSYPITPASEILQELSKMKNFGVVTYQAEDEIAAMCAVVGAAYAGVIATTGTSGPGLALKSEAMGLGVITELPMVIVDVQRGGPSTGLPTKTEQADLLQSMYGRNGDCPIPILAAESPSRCFEVAYEAVRIAVKYMVPVMVLTDGYLAFGAEPWRIPDPKKLPKVEVKYRTEPEGFHPYLRDEVSLTRPWVKLGTPGLEHRIGGLEKSHLRGCVSYNPDNHDFMVRMRSAKVRRILREVPPAEVYGPSDAKILIVGWGSTYGAIRAAIERCHAKKMPVAQLHLRWLNPFPPNLGDILSKYDRIIVPEINLGQLVTMLRATYLVDAKSYTRVAGRPFQVSALEEMIGSEVEKLAKVKG